MVPEYLKNKQTETKASYMLIPLQLLRQISLCKFIVYSGRLPQSLNSLTKLTSITSALGGVPSNRRNLWEPSCHFCFQDQRIISEA